MTDNNHPITPPPELVQQWIKECDNPEEPRWQEYENRIATRAACWGADQELDACCKWLPKLPPWSADDLRKHRRPKPPSLKEQSLELIDLIQSSTKAWNIRDLDVVRRALEALPE